MPAFEYTALNDKGREIKGVIEGDTPRVVRQLLREKSLTPLSVTEAQNNQSSKKTEKANTATTANKISAADLTLITRQLATLSKAGSPLEEALSTVARQSSKNRIKSIILSVRSKVVEGYSLANALREFPKVFPNLYHATVAAGEQSGHLDAVLERLADYTEAREQINRNVMKALIYPALLTTVATLVIGLLMVYVVPEVIQVIENNNQTIPLITQIVMAISNFVQNYWLIGGIAIAALVWSIKKILTVEQYRYRFHRFLLTMPLIGPLNQGINTAQFARTLSILAASGVPILEAMRIAGQVMPNLPMREAVAQATIKVREGASVHGSLEKSKLFPSMTLHLIASGESSGNLEDMLERAAQYQERETETVISMVLALFEPILLLTMGLVVLVIVLAVLLPIMNMTNIVQ